jgi:hypothetical protein
VEFFERCTEGLGSAAASASGEHFIDRVEVEDPKALGLLDGLDELPRSRHPGEVHERSRQACDRDASHDGSVGVGQLPREVHRYAFDNGLPLALNNHMNGWTRTPEQSPVDDARPVTKERSLSAGENSCNEKAIPMQVLRPTA